MEEKKFIKKVKEIIEPAKGAMLDVVSDLFVPGIAEQIAGNFVPAIVAGTVGEVAGSLIPGVGGMIMSYKQARFERNIEKMVSELMRRIGIEQAFYNSAAWKHQKTAVLKKDRYRGTDSGCQRTADNQSI